MVTAQPSEHENGNRTRLFARRREADNENCYITPTHNDIRHHQRDELMQRSIFRSAVERHAKSYEQAKRNDKRLILKQIIDEVELEGCRFLKKTPGNKDLWVEMSEKLKETKVKRFLHKIVLLEPLKVDYSSNKSLLETSDVERIMKITADENESKVAAPTRKIKNINAKENEDKVVTPTPNDIFHKKGTDDLKCLVFKSVVQTYAARYKTANSRYRSSIVKEALKEIESKGCRVLKNKKSGKENQWVMLSDEKIKEKKIAKSLERISEQEDLGPLTRNCRISANYTVESSDLDMITSKTPSSSCDSSCDECKRMDKMAIKINQLEERIAKLKNKNQCIKERINSIKTEREDKATKENRTCLGLPKQTTQLFSTAPLTTSKLGTTTSIDIDMMSTNKHIFPNSNEEVCTPLLPMTSLHDNYHSMDIDNSSLEIAHFFDVDTNSQLAETRGVCDDCKHHTDIDAGHHFDLQNYIPVTTTTFHNDARCIDDINEHIQIPPHHGHVHKSNVIGETAIMTHNNNYNKDTSNLNVETALGELISTFDENTFNTETAYASYVGLDSAYDIPTGTTGLIRSIDCHETVEKHAAVHFDLENITETTGVMFHDTHHRHHMDMANSSINKFATQLFDSQTIIPV